MQNQGGDSGPACRPDQEPDAVSADTRPVGSAAGSALPVLTDSAHTFPLQGK